MDNSEQVNQPERQPEKKIPDISGRVKYTYTSHAQVVSSNVDVRIAFGDRMPPSGEVEPLFGVVMSHSHFEAFLKALQQNYQRFQALLAAKETAKPKVIVE